MRFSFEYQAFLSFILFANFVPFHRFYIYVFNASILMGQ